ncbi:MAG TPA: hypothetical protein VII76_08970 [Acidimicrobiales bacterium]
MKDLKARAAQVRTVAGSAQEENARYRALHNARYVRHWADPDGAFRLDAKLTPDAGATLLSALKAEADVRFHAARKAGQQEPPVAYVADALVALVAGKPAAAAPRVAAPRVAAPRATVIMRVDAKALRRGHATRGEVCEIAGRGPVPVAAVQRQLSDAFVKIVMVDGVDVTTVCHVGRSVPAHLHSALEARDPVCVVPDCEVDLGLEIHHWDVPLRRVRDEHPGRLGPDLLVAPRPGHLRRMGAERRGRGLGVEGTTGRGRLRDGATVSGHRLRFERRAPRRVQSSTISATGSPT